ncbi:MAG: hypothetical protein GX601_04810 [Anaerolineales bacterium]|nr:hypothetical protein [Anaerolineales bacterium]
MRIIRLDPSNQRQLRQYIELPFRLYQRNALWVPPLVGEVRDQLDPQRHPFYQHSEAAFFLAYNGEEAVGRLAVLDNANHTRATGQRTAFFYHFESIPDRAVSRGLFDAAFDWARGRGLETVWGPQGFLAGDGKGLLVDGFEHRPAMGIAYNYPYYGELVEDAGFGKQVDLISCYVDRDISLPERYLQMAEKIRQRGGLRAVRFRSKAELRAVVDQVVAAYNQSFTEIQGFVPITQGEENAIAARILAVADPTLIKVLMRGEEIVGFVLAYPDLSAAVQRCRGQLWPLGWYHLMREARQTQWINFNGGGILPEFRGLGGNALLYAELYDTLIGRTQFQYGDLVQVQETNTRMIQELEALRFRPYKRHRIYSRSLV